MYYMLSPTTGSHDVVGTLSSSTGSNFDLYAASYIGTAAAAFPDSKAGTDGTGTSTGGGPISLSTTPAATGCWCFMHGENENNSLTASTNSTLLQANHGSGIFDSNGTAAAGSAFNMQATFGAGNNWSGIMVSIAPAAAAAVFTKNIFARQAVNRAATY